MRMKGIVLAMVMVFFCEMDLVGVAQLSLSIRDHWNLATPNATNQKKVNVPSSRPRSSYKQAHDHVW